MRHLAFAAVICAAASFPAGAQQVPARDLLQFPLGAMGETPALAYQLSSGLWNPAAIRLPSDARVSAGLAALNSPIEQGVAEQLAVVTVRAPRGMLVTASFARAIVTDLVRTETDPESVGGEIPYGTSVFSLGASRTFGSLTAGVAARLRSGTVDYEHLSAMSVDAGLVADRLLGSPLRLAASTFLLSPQHAREHPALLAAADLPVYHRDSTLVARAGVSSTITEGRGRERYLFGSVRYAALEARGGVAHVTQFGAASDRLRLGLDLHYDRYAVGISREQEGAGLGAVYQFMLTAVFK